MVPATRRTARTRHWTLDHQIESLRWKMYSSRSSAMFVLVEIDFLICGYHTW